MGGWTNHQATKVGRGTPCMPSGKAADREDRSGHPHALAPLKGLTLTDSKLIKGIQSQSRVFGKKYAGGAFGARACGTLACQTAREYARPHQNGTFGASPGQKSAINSH